MSENLDFDSLQPIELEVKIKGRVYALREASEGVAVDHRNAILASTTFVNGKASSVRNLATVEPQFVSGCLFDDNGKKVPVQIITTWPAKIVKKIYAEAKRISGLNEQPMERSLLEKALALEGSPVSYEQLVNWVDNLESEKDEEYDPLKAWFVSVKETENNLKNEPVATTVNSD